MREKRERLGIQHLLDIFKGKTADEIAAVVRSMGIKGRTGTTYKCPLALLLNTVDSGTHIIGREYIVRRSGYTIEKVATPRNVSAFIRKFDLGEYPDLMAPSPKCLGKSEKPRPKRRDTRTKRGSKHHQRLGKLVNRFNLPHDSTVAPAQEGQRDHGSHYADLSRQRSPRASRP